MAADGRVFANDWQGQPLPFRRPGLTRKPSRTVVVDEIAGVDVAAQDGPHQLKAHKAGIVGRPVPHGAPRVPVLVVGE